MITFGSLHSFKDYYLKKLVDNITDSFFLEHFYEPIYGIENILAFVNQVSSSKKAIVISYVKNKDDVSNLLKFLKALRLTKKLDYAKIIVVNDFYGLKNFSLLKEKGVDLIFEQKATKGALHYAIKKYINEFTNVTQNSYFVDISENKTEDNKTFEDQEMQVIENINNESAFLNVLLQDFDLPPISCSLEDMTDNSLVLKTQSQKELDISSLVKRNLKCTIKLNYTTDKVDTHFPVYIKKTEFFNGNHLLFAKRMTKDNEHNAQRIFSIYEKRQKNVSRFVFHSRT